MEGHYKGQPEDTERNAAIGRMRASKQSWGTIQSVTGCSRANIAKIATAKAKANRMRGARAERLRCAARRGAFSAILAVDSGGPAVRWVDLMLDSDFFRGAWWGWRAVIVTMLLYLLFQA